MVICTCKDCQTTAGCQCGKNSYSPRYIRDVKEQVLYERNADGSYSPAFRLTPMEAPVVDDWH